MTAPSQDGQNSNPAIIRELPQHLRRATQMLWETYETLDLCIETTFGLAEKAFLAALPELNGNKEDTLLLIRHLLSGLRNSDGTKPQASHSISLRLVYQDRNTLIQQLLPGQHAQIVVIPID